PDAELERLQGLLAERFPGVAHGLTQELVGGRGLLLTWAGSDPALAPVVLMAHQDVVPATDVEHWTHAPFSGDVADGFVWGRGASRRPAAEAAHAGQADRHRARHVRVPRPVDGAAAALPLGQPLVRRAAAAPRTRRIAERQRDAPHHDRADAARCRSERERAR